MPTTSAIRLLIHGAKGRMGARILALARDDARFAIVAALDRDDQSPGALALDEAPHVIIDFSSDEGAHRAAELAMAHRAALLVGTTGLSPNSLEFLGKIARSVPLMIAPNTSLGVAVLNHLVAEAARVLGPEYSISIVESHHAMKRDAPSGTALRLAHTIQQITGVALPPHSIQSIRGGEVIGDHEIFFSHPQEILKISHFAAHRDLFARGALRAAAWLKDQPPGNYTIEQSLGLTRS